jgi:EAL domain-containing protein (putative c-di-GMP-specific phosphodiesterase class I)
MYQVKNRGGDGYQFFTNEMGDLVQHRITIEHGFVPALENNQFELVYQPQVDIHSGEVIGAEALIRWHHPDLGFISPAEFIPIAEETGFIHDLGDWIIKEALNQLSKWQSHDKNISLAVNVSALQITEEFPEKIDAWVRQYNLRPFSLELEITESLLMENIEFVLPLLNQICEKNIRFAIDDFGTGYSSLSYLRYLPIDKLKIDRAFVMNLEQSEDDVALVRAIVAMAKNLNLKVLAEGIETQPQLEILQTQGCEAYQGYYFSKPVDKDTFYSLYINTSTNVQSQA